MFLRKLRRENRSGDAREYWALIESFRIERGPRQRVVAHLGEAEESERDGIAALASGSTASQRGLFEDRTPQWVEVDSRRVRIERARRFGDVWLALE